MTSKLIGLIRWVKVFGDPEDVYFSNTLKDRAILEDSTLAICVERTRHDDIIFDVGANLGIMTVALANIAQQGQIYAVEPSPHNVESLRQTIAHNHLANVTILPIALGAKEQRVAFRQMRGFGAGSFAIDPKVKDPAIPDTDLLEVNCDALDNVVRALTLERLDGIKLDVEGFELEVLKGAQKTLARFKPWCVVEFNSWVLMRFHRVLPQDALDAIYSAFKKVYRIDRMTAELHEIVSDRDKHLFLHDNVTTGCVDNLLCNVE
jgi:FkbM family methyltransferase